MVLVGCRGNIKNALEAFKDDTVEIDLLPTNKDLAKKLLRAVC